MTSHLVQSAEILDEANDFEQRLNFILAANDQDALLYEEGGWIPGDPLYDRPIFQVGWITTGQQYIRPMFEVIDGFPNMREVWFQPRCKDCNVYWEGDDPCWACGQNRDNVYVPLLDIQGTHIVQSFDVEWTTVTRDMIAAFRNMGVGVQNAVDRMHSPHSQMAAYAWNDAFSENLIYGSSNRGREIVTCYYDESRRFTSNLFESIYSPHISMSSPLTSYIQLPEDLDLTVRHVNPPVNIQLKSNAISEAIHRNSARPYDPTPINRQRRRR